MAMPRSSIFSVMLKIAPVAALRDRLVMSTALTLGMIAVNAAMAAFWH